MHGFHEILIIEKWFPHPHKDHVDAILGWRNPLVIEHRANLANDFASAEVTFHAEQRRHAELAIHRAAHLAGNTNRSAGPFCATLLPFITGLAAVAGFPAIALGHPDGLHALVVSKSHQVTNRAVSRNKLPFDPR